MQLGVGVPYQSGTIKVAMSGALGNGARWSGGFQLMAAAAPTQDQVNVAAQLCADWAADVDGAPAMAFLSPDSGIDTVAAYGYNGGTDASVSFSETIGQPGTGAADALPNQCAVCVSFRTANASRSGRGRIYWPATGVTLTNGQLTGSQCTNLNNSFRTLLEAYAGMGTGLPLTPVVASITHDISRPITRLVVDSRIDIIRHRAQRENILHSYSHAL